MRCIKCIKSLQIRPPHPITQGMKTRLSIPLITLVALSGLASGCKMKKDRELQAAQTQVQVQKDQQVDDQERILAVALERTKEGLRDRIALYSALTGTYQGAYTTHNRTQVNIRLAVRVANVPTAAEIEQMHREDEVRSRTELISLDFRTDERLASDPQYAISCSGTNLKPDFSRGDVHFECVGTGTTASRHYLLAFEQSDLRGIENETPETALSISAAIGNDLVTGKITELGGFRLTLQTTVGFSYEFKGALSRVRPGSH